MDKAIKMGWRHAQRKWLAAHDLQAKGTS